MTHAWIVGKIPANSLVPRMPAFCSYQYFPENAGRLSLMTFKTAMLTRVCGAKAGDTSKMPRTSRWAFPFAVSLEYIK
jgi:hypothetical protein